MNNIFIKVESVLKIFHFYFFVAFFASSVAFLIYNLRTRQKSEDNTSYARLNLVCSACMIVSLAILIVTRRWWL